MLIFFIAGFQEFAIFDKKPANHVKEITEATPVRNVQNDPGKFY
jgi:hypothetical protein